MSQQNVFTAYDYMDIAVPTERAALYVDAFENFGWEQNEKIRASEILGKLILHLRRDRNILNKAELTRLQRQFDACMKDIEKLEASKNSAATAIAIAIGIVGTGFMAGSVFAITMMPPQIWLCVLLAIPGFAGWVLPYFIHKRVWKRQKTVIEPLIEAKYDELYAVCKKGKQLL